MTPCLVCDARRARPRFAIEGMASRIVVCEGCGLGRLDPMPTQDAVRGYYPDDYYGAPGRKFQPPIEALVRLIAARHVRFLTRGLPPGARLLDVGCGRGVLLSALADRGFEPHGFELSEEAVRGVDPRARIRIGAELGEAAYPDDFFDQVIVWHVLEHLAEPSAALVEIRRILRPGGRLVVALPNFASAQARWAGAAWFHLDVPRHLYHFPVSALTTLLERLGYVSTSEHHFSLRQNPFGWVQSALNRTQLPRNGLYVLLHRRVSGEEPPFDARTRRRLQLAYAALFPLGLAASALAAPLRAGATVHVAATLPA